MKKSLFTILCCLFFFSACSMSNNCEYNKQFEYNKDIKAEDFCECEGSWIRYQACPGKNASVNKYVQEIQKIECRKQIEKTKDQKYVAGYVLVSFQEIEYQKAEEIIKNSGGEIVSTVIPGCAWEYDEKNHKKMETSQRLMGVSVPVGTEEEFIDQITQNKEVKHAELNWLFTLSL